MKNQNKIKKILADSRAASDELNRVLSLGVVKITTELDHDVIPWNPDISRVFDYWQKAGIIKHRTIEKVESKIRAALKVYPVDEITEAIDNYKKVLDSNEHFFNYRWGLGDFLVRGLEKFHTENDPFSNYSAFPGKNKIQTNTTTESDSSASPEFKEKWANWKKSTPDERKILEMEWRKKLERDVESN